jgi:toxin YoeB
MKLIFTERGWEDYLWFQANERKLLKKINTLIKDIQREPFEGLGKPEPLKSNLFSSSQTLVF